MIKLTIQKVSIRNSTRYFQAAGDNLLGYRIQKIVLVPSLTLNSAE